MTDTDNHRVQKSTLDGQFISKSDIEKFGNPILTKMDNIDFDTSENMYILIGKIIKY